MGTHYLSNHETRWIKTVPGFEKSFRITPLQPDASSRRYYRLHTPQGQTALLCKIGAEETLAHLLTLHALYQKAGVAIPHILAHHNSHILFEDLGTTHLKNCSPSIAHHFTEICSQILNIQKISTDQALSITSIYEEGSNSSELNDFFTFLPHKSGFEIVQNWIGTLITHFHALPQVFTHHDFHWENIMTYENQVRVIDYHDPRLGPESYDIASLIADRGFFQASPDTAQSLVHLFCTHHKTLSSPDIWLNVALRLCKILGNFLRLSNDVRPDYKDYFEVALQTLSQIPWQQKVPSEHWEPLDTLFELFQGYTTSQR